MTITAVVFDMDGVLIDSEQLWDEVRAELTAEWGGCYTAEAQQAMMGMSSTEWSAYLHDVVGLPQPPAEINAEVVRRMLGRYASGLPLEPGAVDAARRLHAEGAILAVASSSNPPLVAAVLDGAGIRDLFTAVVSSEEVARGKPAPDVYLEACGRIGVPPAGCAAVEDSENGLRAAHAAGLTVAAYPNRHYPPSAGALGLAAVVLDTLEELDLDRLRRAAARERLPRMRS